MRLGSVTEQSEEKSLERSDGLRGPSKSSDREVAHGFPGRFPLIRKRMMWLPTWRGWCLLVLLAACLCAWTARNIHSFLSVTRRVPADVLVIEGWVPDLVLKAAIQEFQQGQYQFIVTSGGPRPRGHLTSDYPTYAAEAAAALRKLGFPQDKIIEAPGEPTLRDRTFHSAQAVKNKLAELNIKQVGLNIVTEGNHARRTWTVFRRVFPEPNRVGVIACPPVEYDPTRWWASSEGAKGTLIEAFGWLHDAIFR